MLFDCYTPIFRTGKRSIIYIKNGVVDERGTEVKSEMENLEIQLPYTTRRANNGNKLPNCLAELILDEGEDWGVNVVTVYDG